MLSADRRVEMECFVFVLAWLLLWFSSVQPLLCLLSVDTELVGDKASVWRTAARWNDHFMDFPHSGLGAYTGESKQDKQVD